MVGSSLGVLDSPPSCCCSSRSAMNRSTSSMVTPRLARSFSDLLLVGSFAFVDLLKLAVGVVGLYCAKELLRVCTMHGVIHSYIAATKQSVTTSSV